MITNKTGVLRLRSPTNNSPVVGGAPGYGFHPHDPPVSDEGWTGKDGSRPPPWVPFKILW